MKPRYSVTFDNLTIDAVIRLEGALKYALTYAPKGSHCRPPKHLVRAAKKQSDKLWKLWNEGQGR